MTPNRDVLLRQSAARPVPTTVAWPIKDDSIYPLWLVPGDWTRGKAVAYVANAEDGSFTRYRARRCWMRWAHMDFGSAGWRFAEGTLVGCERGDEGAEPYWEVVNADESLIEYQRQRRPDLEVHYAE